MFRLKLLFMLYLAFYKKSNAASISTAKLVMKTTDKIAIYESGAQGSRLQMAFFFSDDSSKEITQTTHHSGKSEDSIVIDCPDLISNSDSDVVIKISSNCNSTAAKPQPSTTSLPTTIKPEQSTPSPLPTCKPNFVLLGRNCYHFSKKDLTWIDALKDCQNMGATLAHPMDANEDTLLKNYIVNNNLIDTKWLGGTDDIKEGEWIWSHTGEKITYFNWSIGRPLKDNTDRNCLLYLPSTNHWADGGCTSTADGYICQH